MIRALWLLLKIGFFLGLVLWIAERPGWITIEWMAYTVRIQVGFFLLLILSFVILGILLFSAIKGVLDIPLTWARYRQYQGRARGLRALTLGLTAVAAGDAGAASLQAQRARALLPDKEALPLLLEAQAARLRGEEPKAIEVFTKLLSHRDASFLGLRGLLHNALENGDNKVALELARRALKAQPKQEWVLRVVYDLEIRLQHWEDAQKTLSVLEKHRFVAREKGVSDRVAMNLAQAIDAQDKKDEKTARKALQRAYAFDPKFIPTATLMGKRYLCQGKKRAAIGAIEEAWRNQPHPDLIPLWDECCPQSRGDRSLNRIRWFEKLLELKPESVEGMQALAEVLMAEGMWGEARKYLEKAEAQQPNAKLYQIWARLEERATGDQSAIRSWRDKVSSAPHERVWICKETGRIYDVWMPVSDQGLFNTIVWDFPTPKMDAAFLSWKPTARLAGLP